MKNPLTIFRPKRKQAIKERILKNEEVILEALSKRAKGTKSCPFLLGEQCISDACSFWGEYVNVNNKTGKKFKYYRCIFNQIPELQIEHIQTTAKLVQEQRETQKLLIAMAEELLRGKK